VRVGLKLCGLGGWQQGRWRQVLSTGIASERRVLLLRLIVLLLLLLLHGRLLKRRLHWRLHWRLEISTVPDRGLLERWLLVVHAGLIQLALFAAHVLMHLEWRLSAVRLVRLWRGQVTRLGRHRGAGHWLLVDLTQLMVGSTIVSIRSTLARTIHASFASLRQRVPDFHEPTALLL